MGSSTSKIQFENQWIETYSSFKNQSLVRSNIIQKDLSEIYKEVTNKDLSVEDYINLEIILRQRFSKDNSFILVDQDAKQILKNYIIEILNTGKSISELAKDIKIDVIDKEEEDYDKQLEIQEEKYNKPNEGIEDSLECAIQNMEDNEDDEDKYNSLCVIPSKNKEEENYRPILSKLNIRHLSEKELNTVINTLVINDNEKKGLIKFIKKYTSLLKENLERKCQQDSMRRSTRIKKDTLEIFLHKKFIENLLNTSYQIILISKNIEYRLYHSIPLSSIKSWIKELINEYTIMFEGNVLDEGDILNMFYIGIVSENLNKKIIYKIVIPEKQGKRTLGAGRANFEELYRCNFNLNESKCGFVYTLNSIFDIIETISKNNKYDYEDILKAFVLWCDTHHDFKQSRIMNNQEYVSYFWDKVVSPNYKNNFIGWYSDQFFSKDPIKNNINQKRISPFKDNDNINKVYFYIENIRNTVFHIFSDMYLDADDTSRKQLDELSTLFYTLSVKFMRNKDFEKNFLCTYIIKYYAYKDTSNNVDKIKEGQDILNDLMYIKNKNIDESIIKKFPNKTKFDDQIPKYFIKLNDNMFVQDAVTSVYDINMDKKYIYSSLFDANTSNTSRTDTYYNGKKKLNNNDIIDVEIGNKIFKYTKQKNSTCDINVIFMPNQKMFTDVNLKNINFEADVKCYSDVLKQRNFVEYCKRTDGTIDKKFQIIKMLEQFKKKYNETNIIQNIDNIYQKFENLLVEFNSNQKLKPDEIKGMKFISYNNFQYVNEGPSVKELFNLILFYLIGNNLIKQELTLDEIDLMLNLKRTGDYGQVLEVKKKNLSMNTSDSMESVMCLMEKVSCIIDIRPGVFFYVGTNTTLNQNGITDFFISIKQQPINIITNSDYKYNGPSSLIDQNKKRRT
jgi:hypothetical protein